MRLSNWHRIAALGLAATLAATPADAAIIIRDYLTAGDRGIIYDSDLGLEFLRLTFTYQVAQADLPARLPGFRIARQNEVDSLLVDLGLTGLRSGGNSSFSVAQGQPVMDAIGALVFRDFGRGSTQQASYAHFLTAAGNYASYNISFNTGFVQPVGMSVVYQDWSLSNNPPASQRGTYMVRAAAAGPAVPEPTTWALFIAGLGTTGVAMRRKAARVRAAA